MCFSSTSAEIAKIRFIGCSNQYHVQRLEGNLSLCVCCLNTLQSEWQVEFLIQLKPPVWRYEHTAYCMPGVVLYLLRRYLGNSEYSFTNMCAPNSDIYRSFVSMIGASRTQDWWVKLSGDSRELQYLTVLQESVAGL